MHTNEFHYLAWKQLTDRLGIPFDESVNKRLLGLSRADSLEVVLERSATAFSAAQKQALCDEKNQIYRSYLAATSPKDLPADVLPTLCALRRQGLKLAVGSSSKNARFLLEKLQLTNQFDGIVDGTQVVHGKPNPEVFFESGGSDLHAAAKLFGCGRFRGRNCCSRQLRNVVRRHRLRQKLRQSKFQLERS